MPLITDPKFTFLYGMDENGALAVRKNTAAGKAANSDLDTVFDSGSGAGVPTVPDGRGGRAADFGYYATASSEHRGLVHGENGVGFGSIPGIPDVATIFADPAGSGDPTAGLSWGARFRIDSLSSPGNRMFLWSFAGWDAAGSAVFVKLGCNLTISGSEAMPYFTAPGTSTSNHNQLSIFTRDTNYDDPGESTPGYVLVEGEWYRIICTVVNTNELSATTTNVTVHVWIYRESNGAIYHYTKEDPRTYWDEFGTVGVDTFGLVFGAPITTSSSGGFPLEGPLNNFWLYEGYLDETDAPRFLVSGITIPFEAPSLRYADHDVYAATTDEAHGFPKTRKLPTGATVARYPSDRYCQRARQRFEAWRAGRPWALTSLHFIFDSIGPFASKHGNRYQVQDLRAGLWRSPGDKPSGALQDVLNVVYTEQGYRSRRGFTIRRDVSEESESAVNSLFTWRAYDDQLFWAYKVGTKLYKENGSTSPTELDTGWGHDDLMTGFTLDNRAVLLADGRRKVWNGEDSVGDLSIAAPTSVTTGAIAGSLSGTYYYAATWYDPTTGDESGPAITSASTSPSGQGVRVTINGTRPESRYTKCRVYRTGDGGSPPALFYLGEVDSGTGSSRTYDDTAGADGTSLVDQVLDADGNLLGYITSATPATFTHGFVHKGRAFYLNSDYPERIYWTEPGKMNRWYSGSWQAADGGPILAAVSWRGRVVLFTRTTVEILEGDFLRDADGNANVVHTTLSSTVGCLGKGAVLVYGSQLAWMDRLGVYTLHGDEAVPLTDRLSDLFPYVNLARKGQITCGWNHVRREVWFSLPMTTQEDSSRNQTQLAFNPNEPEKWTIHGLDACWVGPFDDDRNGLKFGAMDHLGILKELEDSHGDGTEADETYTTEDAGTDAYGSTPAGIKSVSGRRVTVYDTGVGWTDDLLRGFGVVLRDRSTGALHYYTIVGNGTSGSDHYFDCERDVDTDLAAGDGWYLGGFPSFIELAESDLATENRKAIRQVQAGFADLTQTDLYL